MGVHSTVSPLAFKAKDKKLKAVMIRDVQTGLAKVLLEGGEYLVYKGKEPYRYMKIMEVKIAKGGLSDEEFQKRVEESSEVVKEVLEDESYQ